MKQVYERLRFKCENCGQELTTGTVNDHDFPAKVFNCIKCGFNDHVPKGQKNDCINCLENRNERLMDENRELRTMCEQFLKFYRQNRLEDDSSDLDETDSSGLNVSNSNVVNVSSAVVFNDDETFASEKIKKMFPLLPSKYQIVESMSMTT